MINTQDSLEFNSEGAVVEHANASKVAPGDEPPTELASSSAGLCDRCGRLVDDVTADLWEVLLDSDGERSEEWCDRCLDDDAWMCFGCFLKFAASDLGDSICLEDDSWEMLCQKCAPASGDPNTAARASLSIQSDELESGHF